LVLPVTTCATWYTCQSLNSGLPHLPLLTEICTDCIKGKQYCDRIPKQSNWRATQKLEFIHADICGPITPISNSNKRYILLFIDDYNRKAWVYFLVEKSETLHSFKCFKIMVEKEAEISIQMNSMNSAKSIG